MADKLPKFDVTYRRNRAVPSDSDNVLQCVQYCEKQKNFDPRGSNNITT
jgi:hypothetical protein